jgi:cell wall assembly regulator SMI1
MEADGWGSEPDYATDDITGPIKPYWWGEARLLVTDNSGDHLVADLDPAEGGTVGQIIHHSHEVGPQEVLAPSWRDWLRAVADGLERGDYECFEEEATVAPLGYYGE